MKIEDLKKGKRINWFGRDTNGKLKIEGGTIIDKTKNMVFVDHENGILKFPISSLNLTRSWEVTK